MFVFLVRTDEDKAKFQYIMEYGKEKLEEDEIDDDDDEDVDRFQECKSIFTNSGGHRLGEILLLSPPLLQLFFNIIERFLVPTEADRAPPTEIDLYIFLF